MSGTPKSNGYMIIGFTARVLRCLLVALVVLASCGRSTPPDAILVGRAITFQDEFDGAAGSPPDAAVWWSDVGGAGWGNDELQYYTDGDNTFLDGAGHLVIEAREESGDHSCWYGERRYTSGKLSTYSWSRPPTFAQKYGRFEARIKVPIGEGMFPAFWLLGDNIKSAGHPEAGEIDVMESLGHRANEVQQHAHGPDLDFGSEMILPPGQSVEDWHTYAVEWTSDRIDWQVDGTTTRTLTKEEADEGWVFDHPFFMILNLAVGGDWPGSPDSSTVFPARMLVDYVRVYEAQRG